MLRRRDLRPLLVVAVIGVLAATAGTLGLDAGWLHLAPVLVLLLPLLAGRYVGEERLVCLTGAFAARRGHPAQRRVAPLRPRAFVPRGGLLLASALAERGPPA
jgi:hypothetical protein